MRLHGALRDVERDGDLGDREPVDVEQGGRRPLLLGELGQQPPELVWLDRVLRDLLAGRQAGDRPVLAGPAPVPVPDLVDGDPAYPPDRVVVSADPAPLEMGLDERPCTASAAASVSPATRVSARTRRW
jgi:hypothetical protein